MYTLKAASPSRVSSPRTQSHYLSREEKRDTHHLTDEQIKSGHFPLLTFAFVFLYLPVSHIEQTTHKRIFNTALGQVMLYVDGMNGVIKHNETIQWLYSLISAKVSLGAPSFAAFPPVCGRMRCTTVQSRAGAERNRRTEWRRASSVGRNRRDEKAKRSARQSLRQC